MTSIRNTKPNVATAKKAPVKNKKPKDMPKRPLSAYNMFFKAERVHWLKENTAADYENEPQKKRFINMTAAIGVRWRSLSAEERIPYEKEAEKDMKRYREEMEVYNQNLVLRSKASEHEGRTIEVPKAQLVAQQSPGSLGSPRTQEQQQLLQLQAARSQLTAARPLMGVEGLGAASLTNTSLPMTLPSNHPLSNNMPSASPEVLLALERGISPEAILLLQREQEAARQRQQLEQLRVSLMIEEIRKRDAIRQLLGQQQRGNALGQSPLNPNRPQF